MAEFLSTTFGKISGKHGTAVAAVVNGKSVIKVFNPPSNPNSPAQQTQRLKFGLVMTTLNLLRSLIYIGFGSKAGFYGAVSYALRNAVEGVYPNFSINYGKMLVSSGSLPQSPEVTVTVVAGVGVDISWDTATWNTGSSDDSVYIGFLNPDMLMPYFDEAKGTRKDGKLTVTLPEVWKGATVHGWLFFVSPDGQLSSVSQYLGAIVPA